jgi:ERCC4-type nuclease
LKALGKSSSIPERYGCDYLIIANGQKTGVQRKEFPSDFISSVADGRLYSLVREMSKLDRAVVIIEGYGRWMDSGELDFAHSKMTRQQFHGLVFSLTFEWGIEVWQNGGLEETKTMLLDLEAWCKKAEHTSLNSRPGPKRDGWGLEDPRHRALHVLQSFEGIGPELAGRIFDHFGRVPFAWDVTVNELMEVPGVGKQKAKNVAKVLPFIREVMEKEGVG